MRKITKKEITLLRAEASQPEKWEKVEGFTNLTRPAAIRLTPTLAKRLNTLAAFHGTENAEVLAKRWLTERIDYELGLIDKARRQAS
jgi:hypothetical protein